MDCATTSVYPERQSAYFCAREGIPTRVDLSLGSWHQVPAGGEAHHAHAAGLVGGQRAGLEVTLDRYRLGVLPEQCANLSRHVARLLERGAARRNDAENALGT